MAAARSTDDASRNTAPSDAATTMLAFQRLHYRTMQAVCNHGGRFTSSNGGAHDFTSFGLTAAQWLACHRSGTGCRDAMVAAVRAVVDGVPTAEATQEGRQTDTDVPTEGADSDGSNAEGSGTATPDGNDASGATPDGNGVGGATPDGNGVGGATSPSTEGASGPHQALLATIDSMHVRTLKAVCNHGGIYSTRKDKGKDVKVYDFSAFGFSSAVWKACGATGTGSKQRMVAAIKQQLSSGSKKIPDTGLRAVVSEVREAADVGNLRDEEVASLVAGRPVDCSHDLSEIRVLRGSKEVRRLVRQLNRFAFRIVYWNHGVASADKLPDVWQSFRRHLRCAHGDDDLPEVLVVCEVLEEVQRAIVDKGYTAIKSRSYTTTRHHKEIPAGFEVTMFLRNGKCALIDDSTGREDRYVTAAITFPDAPEAIKDVPFSLLGVHLNWKVTGKRDRYPKLMDWFAGVHEAGMPLALAGDFNTHTFSFLDDPTKGFVKLDAQRRNDNVDVMYMHLCNATCVSDESIAVEHQAHPLLAMRVFMDGVD